FILAVVAHVSVSPSTAAALEKPIIKLTSPSGGLVWVSGHAEVTRGHSFIFNCSLNSNNSSDYFILKFSSQDNSKRWTSQSNSFNFYEAEYDHEGNYSCVHEGNRNNTSPESDPIYVTIKYPLLKLLLYSVVPGATLLLLVLVLIVVLVCRRRRRDRRPESVTLTQTAAVRNNYNDDEEEEQDYINVDPGDSNRKLNPVASEEDEDGNDYENLEDKEDSDYEKPEDDDDNDYENLQDEDDNVKATKAAVAAKKQREEDCDEEESSDDEHDYVNLDGSISEQTVDIYEGQQDIYQNT
ncbi:uncharacterized protein LOC106534691, partial [Austrofundulus limnaeus]|uniref:Uncharacterized protein LOC106534691 n=1 Tax=Austrofundulus limnaeus TaxID=52670 RepID=A0A2I4D3N4_AUSLI